MDINQLTKIELLNLPQKRPSKGLTANEVIIVPTYRKHDSGLSLCAVIAPVKKEYKIIGYIDAVLIEGVNYPAAKDDRASCLKRSL